MFDRAVTEESHGMYMDFLSKIQRGSLLKPNNEIWLMEYIHIY
jgi:hypothetical protein